jgi:hypothetical protein
LIAAPTIPSISVTLVGGKEVDCPLESFCDLLGISAKKANEYLCAAKLMEPHNRYKTLCPIKASWDSLQSEFALDIELAQVTDIHFLGKKMHVMRIGCLCDDNQITFNAREQAKRFFVETGWKPKRLRATRQSNEFLSTTSLDLTIFMAKQQKELDEKERKKAAEEREKDGGYDGDGDADSSNDKSKDDEFSLYKSPATPNCVKFNMKDAQTGPIRWTSPNGKQQTAIRIPNTSTRSSFQKPTNEPAGLSKLSKACAIKRRYL